MIQIRLKEIIPRTYWGKFYSRGFLVSHAGAVSNGEWAVMYPGVSGAGKTTIVRMLSDEGYIPLGDELMLIYSIGSQVYVSPVEAFFKGNYNRIKPKQLRAKLAAVVQLKPSGDGNIIRYHIGRDGLFFIYGITLIPNVTVWKKIVNTISLIYKLPSYIANRPELPKLIRFSEQILRGEHL